MKFWPDEFLEVCYRADQYALAVAECACCGRYPPVFQEKLRRRMALDKARLEAAIAEYRVYRRKENGINA